jgi:hypothetical protein
VSLILPIVEGHSEVGSLPVLLRRILNQRHIYEDRIAVGRPIRVQRYSVVKEGKLERAVELAVLKGCDAILVVLDANSDCPAEFSTGHFYQTRRLQSRIARIGEVHECFSINFSQIRVIRSFVTFVLQKLSGSKFEDMGKTW